MNNNMKDDLSHGGQLVRTQRSREGTAEPGPPAAPEGSGAWRENLYTYLQVEKHKKPD